MVTILKAGQPKELAGSGQEHAAKHSNALACLAAAFSLPAAAGLRFCSSESPLQQHQLASTDDAASIAGSLDADDIVDLLLKAAELGDWP